MFLRQEQRLVLDQLGRRDPLLADIYFGGLRAFADETNPYRFQLAGYRSFVPGNDIASA
jgi:hypothetical protein